MEKLNVTASYPSGIPQIDFTPLIPPELRGDVGIVNDLSKKLGEAVRHKQRIARANFICDHKANQLLGIFERSTVKETRWKELLDLINETKYEQQWTGSMPSVEWFMRRKAGILSKRKGSYNFSWI